MSDLIDRQSAINVLEILADKMSDEGQTVYGTGCGGAEILTSGRARAEDGGVEFYWRQYV